MFLEKVDRQRAVSRLVHDLDTVGPSSLELIVPVHTRLATYSTVSTSEN